MKIGTSIPNWKIPVLQNRGLIFRSLSHYGGQWVALTCLSHMGPPEIQLFSRVAADWKTKHATLLSLVTNEHSFQKLWHHQYEILPFPIFGDPLGRLGRVLNLYPLVSLPRCESLLIDPHGRLQFRLIHDFHPRMMQALWHILEIYREGREHTDLQKVETSVELAGQI